MKVWFSVRSSKAAGGQYFFQGWVEEESVKAKRAFWRGQRDEYGFPFRVTVKRSQRRGVVR